MPVYDIAFSLNRAITIKANTYEEAEAQLKAQLEKEGVDFEVYEFDPYDTVENEDE